MKQLTDSEKPYEKCLHYGTEVLSDAELLAIILRTGTKGRSCVNIAQEFLTYKDKSILNLYSMTLSEMMQINGIGQTKAIQLKCLAEITKRMTKTSRLSDVKLQSAGSVAAYYMEELRHERREKLMIAMFDAKCELLSDALLSIGSINASLVSTREIFQTALYHQAVYVIMIHNHPSGNPTPSEEDLLVTRKVYEAGKLLEITLADHIIIGDNRYFSFKEEHLL